MKRPEGFDPPGRQQQPPPGRKPVQPSRSGRPPEVESSACAPTEFSSSARAHPVVASAKTGPRTRRETSSDRRAIAADSSAQRFVGSRVEPAIVALATAAIVGVLVTLAALVVTAVYSPILALRTITVDGTSRVSAEQVTAAVDEQIGTPLALIDYGKITNQLGAFPLIRSYVTETIPPSTLIIHVVERTPVGAILVGRRPSNSLTPLAWSSGIE